MPEAGDFGFEKIFALDGGLDELHAISFEKGCYVGQELTARMKHRATSRKRPLIVTADGPLPPPGAAITQDGDIGEIIAAQGSRGFASLRAVRRHQVAREPDNHLQARSAEPAAAERRTCEPANLLFQQTTNQIVGKSLPDLL